MLLYVVILTALYCGQPTDGVGCTLASQWTAEMTHVSSVANGGQVISKIYFDHTNNRTTIQYVDFSGINHERQVIDYSLVRLPGIRTTIETNLTCNVQTESGSILEPNFTGVAGAEHLGTSYVGDQTGESVAVEFWRFPGVAMAVTVPDCVLMQLAIANPGSSSATILFFNGYTAGIADTSVFDTNAVTSNISRNCSYNSYSIVIPVAFK